MPRRSIPSQRVGGIPTWLASRRGDTVENGGGLGQQQVSEGKALSCEQAFFFEPTYSVVD